MFYLEKLELRHFRCHDKYTCSFNSKLNVISGANAIGKTSIIEAIYCLGLAKSFKTNNDKEMIQADQAFARAKGIFQPMQDEITFIVSAKGKKILKNQAEYKQLSQHIGFFNIVVFTPEDLDIVKGAPAQRRKFIDTNFAQINNKYLHELVKYKQILKQRNELLKKEPKKASDLDMLSIYTDQLIQSASILIRMREAFLKSLQPYANKKMQLLSGGAETLEIVYKPSCNVENLRKTFEDKKEYELLTKTTVIGPHRDDFILYINGKEVDIYGSQGQQRSATLALKLGIGDFIVDNNQKLIVLLDDVFSELDEMRQNQILDLINGESQIFITTTTTKHLSKHILDKCKIIELDKDGE